MANTKTATDETVDLPEKLGWDDLAFKTCPNCHTGVMIPTVYDPDARFEFGQDIPESRSSGGSMQRRCFHCDYSDSTALQPGADYGKAV